MTDSKKIDEEKALPERRPARGRTFLKWKLLGGAILLAVVVIWVMAHVWTWLLGLALALGIGVPIYLVARRKVRALGQRRLARIEADRGDEKQRIAKDVHVEDAESEAREIEDELAALKKKARR